MLAATLLSLSACVFAAGPPVAHQTGAYDATLAHRSPDSAPQKLIFRHGLPQDWQHTQDYDLAQETVRFHVPDDYDPQAEPMGLLVWASPSGSGAVPRDYAQVLAEHRLIWVGAHGNGNRRQLMQRLGLTLDAAFNAPLYYTIDPERVYIAGLSGGGRLSSRLGVNHAELFRGALPIIGCDFYRPVEAPSRPGSFWRSFHGPTKRSLRNAQRQPLVIVTGTQDGNREQCQAYAKAYEKVGFKAVSYINVPNMGHTLPPAKVFGDALALLDQRPEPATPELKRHATGQKHLNAALAKHAQDPPAGLKALRRVALRYDDTPAGRQARFTADRLEFPVAAPTDPPAPTAP